MKRGWLVGWIVSSFVCLGSEERSGRGAREGGRKEEGLCEQEGTWSLEGGENILCWPFCAIFAKWLGITEEKVI